MARSTVPGLPKRVSPMWATWSLPMISASSNWPATARAFSTARRSAVAWGVSPGSGVSSMSGRATSKGSPKRCRSSRR